MGGERHWWCVQWWLFYRRWVGSWVEKRERNERARERAREKARLKASERGRFIALQNDRERKAAPAAPRPLGRSASEVPVFVLTRSLPQRARRGGVWGRRSRSKTPLQFRYPRARWGLRELSPKRPLIARLPHRARRVGRVFRVGRGRARRFRTETRHFCLEPRQFAHLARHFRLETRQFWTVSNRYGLSLTLINSA